MKIIVGIGDQAQGSHLISWLEAFRFPEPELEMVSVLEHLGYVSEHPLYTGHIDHALARYEEMQEKEAKRSLAAVAELVRNSSFKTAHTHFKRGLVSNTLTAYAKETGADLLALGSSGKGRIEGMIVGSVGRKAVIHSPCSLLIAKKVIPSDHPLHLVFATDHSAYADRCLQKLIAWAPKGIHRIVVTSVLPEQLTLALSATRDDLGGQSIHLLQEGIENANRKITTKLSALAPIVTSRVESGNVCDTLEKVMVEERADLLVVGAQGHGFFDRLTTGSVSLEQVIKRSYSVLVLRADS